MDVQLQPEPEAQLRQLFLVVMFAGLLYSIVTVTLASRLERRKLWVIWLVGVSVLTALSTLYFLQSFAVGMRPSLTVTAYMTATAIGIPTAFSAWIALRLETSPTRRSIVSRVLRTFGCFVLALPVGFLVAAVPDMVALF
jgi:hypothetical protein